MQGKRLDVYLVEIGECESREIAKRLIMAGKVLVNEIVAAKSSQMVKENDTIRVKDKPRYVSRGGLKLEKALGAFPIAVEGLSILDIGASTGGFSDCLLQKGANDVCAVDVGYGQLHWKLRNDDRVLVLERTNARHITTDDVQKLYDGAVCDASFISLTMLLPAIDACTNDDAFFIGLIKPQFECGRDKIGKGGIVRDPKIHIETIEKVVTFIDKETNFNIQQLDYSPITGPKGNMEFLLFCQKNITKKDINPLEIVENAHLNLKKTKK